MSMAAAGPLDIVFFLKVVREGGGGGVRFCLGEDDGDM